MQAIFSTQEELSFFTITIILKICLSKYYLDHRCHVEQRFWIS